MMVACLVDWLDKKQLAEKDEFNAKQKELGGVVNPIMMVACLVEEVVQSACREG